MTRLITVLSIGATLGVLVPAMAFAKGASEATIVGPGLSDPIKLAGEGQPGGETLMQIAGAAGFFPAVFGQSPDPMLDEQPAGSLGPKYTVTYVMPGPGNELDELVQSIYPYASPSPVTYVEPGQPFWTTEKTRGGWYVAGTTLRDQLAAAGLSEDPPGAAPPSESPWKVLGPAMALVFVTALGSFAAFLIRRRLQVA